VNATPSGGALVRSELIAWAAFVGLLAVAFTVAGWLADGFLTVFAIAFGAWFWLAFLGLPAAIALSRAGSRLRARAQALAFLLLGLVLGAITGIAAITMPTSDFVGHATPAARIGLVALLAALMGGAQVFGWWLRIPRARVDEG